MPRYFFHLHCLENTVLDSSGADLRDADQAWEAARATARDLMEHQGNAAVNWLACLFEVTDEASIHRHYAIEALPSAARRRVVGSVSALMRGRRLHCGCAPPGP